MKQLGPYRFQNDKLHVEHINMLGNYILHARHMIYVRNGIKHKYIWGYVLRIYSR